MPDLERKNVELIVVDKRRFDLGALSVSQYQGFLPPHIQEQLIAYSRLGSDEAITKFTNDAVRFADRSAIAQWLTQERSIYLLTDPEGNDLYGLMWLGDKPLPEAHFTEDIRPEAYRFTMAKRLYQAARGGGLSRVFVQEVFRDFFTSDRYSKYRGSGIWASNSADNERIFQADSKFGFRIVSTPDAQNKVITVATYQEIMNHIDSFTQPPKTESQPKPELVAA